MRRTQTRLADGRRLIYFDEPLTDTDRDVADGRHLPPVATSSELRHDPLTDEWVVVASHRQARTHLPPADECPLCPSTPDRSTEIPAGSYDVVVFENRFSSLPGRCEVVCFTDRHDVGFGELSPDRARTVIEVWVDRTEELARADGVELVFPFENRGAEIGVTLGHPHGQIYAYPFVPQRVRRRIAAAQAHTEATGSCLWCDAIERELAESERIVATSEHWVAYVPFAARWPYEVHLLPRRHLPDLPALSAAERDDLAAIYLEVLAGVDGLFDRPTPYIAAWQQAPVHNGRESYHLSLELFSIRRAEDKLKYLAGSESAMGVFINDIPPELAAAQLRTHPTPPDPANPLPFR